MFNEKTAAVSRLYRSNYNTKYPYLTTTKKDPFKDNGDNATMDFGVQNPLNEKLYNLTE